MSKETFDKKIKKFQGFRADLEASHDVDISLFKLSLDNPQLFDGSETLANGNSLEAQQLIEQITDDHERFMLEIDKQFELNKLDGTQLTELSALKEKTVELFHSCLTQALDAVSKVDHFMALAHLVNVIKLSHPIQKQYYDTGAFNESNDEDESILKQYLNSNSARSPVFGQIPTNTPIVNPNPKGGQQYIRI